VAQSTSTQDTRCVELGRILAEHLAPPCERTGSRHQSDENYSVSLGGLTSSGFDPDLSGALWVELRSAVGDDLLARLHEQTDSRERARLLTERLARPCAEHGRETLWLLVGGADRISPPSTVEATRQGQLAKVLRRVQSGLHIKRLDWVERQAAAVWMNVIIALTIVAAWFLWHTQDKQAPAPTLALKGFALWCLAFLPCWLYVRFLGQRAGAVWDEYVLNLHRLGWDEPRFLPRPIRTSQFYAEWVEDGGRGELQDRNIYRQKFNAYYGRSVSDTARGTDFRVRLETLFPVFLTTAVLAVGWVAVFWDDRFLRSPDDVTDVLKFGFIGAYVFVAQMLLRRFFASDLRPSAYTSVLLRIVVVLLSVLAVYQLLQIWLAHDPDVVRWEALIAFAIGFLPLMASQVIIRAASATLRVTTKSFEPDYPLDQIDGLGIWYEAQLAEENIDDMQTLATANLVDVLLHTRVPVGRLVDWVDQALLSLHLDRVERGIVELRRARKGSSPAESAAATGSGPAGGPMPTRNALPKLVDAVTGSSVTDASRGGTRTRTILRQHGIRTATDLLTAFPVSWSARKMTDAVERMCHGDAVLAEQIQVLARVLAEDPALAPVWNWRDRGVRARCTRRRPPGDGVGMANAEQAA
jgi:hypothetical protein